MKKINIQFLFFDDKACRRCQMAENSLREAVEEFQKRHKNIDITVEKQNLSKEEVEKSPTILLNGQNLESYLSSSSRPQADYCPDCSCLVDQSVSCRTYGRSETLSKKQILVGLEGCFQKDQMK